ncbi:hypothetical protein [Kitasatospora sp. NPDC059327]|uniref:hypothetical protein n=1 Tax=Kitasatospora sp. NPDC059327 TaxID=3346803 RepID=UPI0036A90D8D
MSPGARPWSVVAGFALLLVVVFVAAFALGRGAGPVSPGLTPGSGGGGGAPGMSGHDMGAGR